MVARTSGQSGLARHLRPLVLPLSRWAERRRITSNRMAVLSTMVMLVAVVWLMAGDLPGTLIAAAVVFVVVLLDLAAQEISGAPQPPADFAAALARLSEGLLWTGVALGGVAAGFADMWLWATAAALCFGLRCVLVASRRSSSDVRPCGAAGGCADSFSPVREFDPSRPTPDAASPHNSDFAAEIFAGSARSQQDTDQADTPHPPAATVASGSQSQSQSRSRTRAALAAVIRFGSRVGREERLAVVCVTLIWPDPRVTFVALLAMGVLGLVAQLGPVTAPSTARVVA